MARGDSGVTSNVAKAGAPVSPAAISPPRPLDFLLRVCWVLIIFDLERGVDLSLEVVASSGKASTLAACILERYGGADSKRSSRKLRKLGFEKAV
jgi:hypothetical protein